MSSINKTGLQRHNNVPSQITNDARRIASALILLLPVLFFLQFSSEARARTAVEPAHVRKPSVKSQKLSATEQDLQDAHSLTAKEAGGEKAGQRLKARPHDVLVQEVRDWLSDANALTNEIALDLITYLRLTELQTDLIVLAKTTNSWKVFLALNEIYSEKNQAAVATIYQSRLLESLSGSAQVTLLEGLIKMKAPLTTATFDRLLASPRFAVREETASSFYQTRSTFSIATQIKRFHALFYADPVELRLRALNTFAALDSTEKNLLKSAIDKTLCDKEPSLKVNEACLNLLKSSSSWSPMPASVSGAGKRGDP